MANYKIGIPAAEASAGIALGAKAAEIAGILLGDGRGGISAATPGTDCGFPLLVGNGAPSKYMMASIGQFYFDIYASSSPYLYLCIGHDADGIKWTPLGSGGSDFKILDYYTTLEELQNAVASPQVGDAYGVGADHPYDIYIYSMSKGWVNNGQIQGAVGAKGDRGEQGEQGERGEAYVLTDADKDIIAAAVLASLPTWSGGAY